MKYKEFKKAVHYLQVDACQYAALLVEDEYINGQVRMGRDLRKRWQQVALWLLSSAKQEVNQ